MTIEERAKAYCANSLYSNDITRKQYSYRGYVRGAADQDPISRADEKEKVLNEVCEWLRNYEPLWQSNCIASDLINKLRQSMEK